VFTLVLFGGIFAGVALGGVLADRLGQRNVFLLSAALIAASALLSARLIAPGVGVSATRTATPRMREMLGPLRDTRFAALVLGVAIPSNVVLQAFASYLVALTLDGLGASTADIGRTLMLFFLSVVAGGPLAGRLAEAGAPASANALAGAALASASLLLVAALPSTLTMIVAMVGSGAGHGMVRSAQVALSMTMAEAGLARFGPAVVLGGLRTFERLGSVAGLVVIAAVAGYAGYGAATIAVAGWTLAGAVLSRVQHSKPGSDLPASLAIPSSPRSETSAKRADAIVTAGSEARDGSRRAGFRAH
jgi:predicted MFS family arabinose efflux permease